MISQNCPCPRRHSRTEWNLTLLSQNRLKKAKNTSSIAPHTKPGQAANPIAPQDSRSSQYANLYSFQFAGIEKTRESDSFSDNSEMKIIS